MNNTLNNANQVKLKPKQLEAWFGELEANVQIDHFNNFVAQHDILRSARVAVDIGGGCGSFARRLADETGLRVRVIDQDENSIEYCRKLNSDSVEATVGDALDPKIVGDENIVCFNMVLHHLVGESEIETISLQKAALKPWKDQAEYVFVNECIYESKISDISGRMIFEITSNKTLSMFCSVISKFIPSLRANTFGVGVRFRSLTEWKKIFAECGYEVVAISPGEIEKFSLARRVFLMIDHMHQAGFLLRAQQNNESLKPSYPGET